MKQKLENFSVSYIEAIAAKRNRHGFDEVFAESGLMAFTNIFLHPVRALTPLIYAHVTPCGTFRIDMSQRGWPLNKCRYCLTATFSATCPW